MAEIAPPSHQKDFKQSVERSGQFNFGLVKINLPTRPSWEPNETMFVSKPAAWERNYRREGCHPNPKWIETEAELQALVDVLESQDEFCVQLRSCSYNALIPYTTLLQIATWDRGDFLISAMPLRDAIARTLKSVLENPTILKVMCDSESQVIDLQRDYSIYIHGIADVLELAKITKPACSTYFELCKEYCSIDLAELVHPPSEMWILKSSHDDFTHFATHQVHFVLRKFNRLRHEAPRDELAQCFINSRLLSEKICQIPSEDSACISPLSATAEFVAQFTKHRQLWTKNCNFQNFGDQNKQTMVALLEFRQTLSKVMNVIPEEIMTDRKLFKISYDRTNILNSDFIRTMPLISYTEKAFLLDILVSENPETVMAKLRAHVCQNCVTTGHGYSSLCIFPKFPDNKTSIEYFNLFNSFCTFPQNDELKKAYEIQLESFRRRQQKREQEALEAMQQLQNFNW